MLLPMDSSKVYIINCKFVYFMQLLKYIEPLMKLGLTKSEAKTYLYLLVLKKAGAYKISKEANIPTSKIYTILSNLIKKGFVEIVSENPKIYVPVDPEKACFRAFENKIKELKIAKDKISELSRYYEKPDDIGNIIKINGRKNTFEIINELFSESENLDIFMLEDFDEINKIIKSYYKNRKIRIVVGKKELLEKYKKFRPKILDLMIFHKLFVVGDEKSIILPAFGEKLVSYLILDKDTVELSKKTFEELWKNAREVG